MDRKELENILDGLGTAVKADLMAILEVVDDWTLRVQAVRGPLADAVPVGMIVRLDQRPILAAAIKGARPRLIHDQPGHDVHEPDTYADVLELPESHTCLVAPLRADDELVGVLTLDSIACRAFSEQQLRAVEGFAKLAALALAQGRRAERLAREVDHLLARVAELHQHGDAGTGLVGKAPAWRRVMEKALLVARTSATVLITGETGTGKELIARAIHQWSDRASGPFVALNCSALVPELALSELFGHEKGAFTGADRRRAGRFELADGGTLLLDEVAELPPAAQAQLLRVLQERTFERVGGAGKLLHTDVRVIAATHKDLRAETTAGRFREDLYYRLCAFPIHVPPLRERPGDVALLALHFVEQVRNELDMAALRLDPATLRVLESYDWPGNVRELRNVIERAAILAGGTTIAPQHIELPPAANRPLPASAAPAASPADADFSIPAGLRRLDQALAREITAALAEAGGKVAGPGGAAQRLGVKPTTLHSMMKRLGLRRPGRARKRAQ